MPDKVVVTGGAGFIGSHLTKKLVQEGYDVSVFDSLQLSYGKLENLKDVLSEIDFIRGDIRDFSSVARALKKARIVFHLSAISHLPICRANPLQAFEVNSTGTLNVLEASRANNVERVIFAGTDHIYGFPQYLPINEKHPYNPIDAYSLTKVQAIELCKLFNSNYDLDTRILISGNVFGEFQDASKVTPIFSRQALANHPLTVDGGKQSRDFYYVGNLVNAYLLLANTPKTEDMVFNVGGTQEISILTLAEKIIEVSGSRSELIKREYRDEENSAMRLLLDKSKIEQIGYKQEVDFEEGLARTIEWYRQNP